MHSSIHGDRAKSQRLAIKFYLIIYFLFRRWNPFLPVGAKFSKIGMRNWPNANRPFLLGKNTWTAAWFIVRQIIVKYLVYVQGVILGSYILFFPFIIVCQSSSL
jgi:hypothetical protein